MSALRRLPTLRGLQAFEAVARAGNLADAAALIGITASAVSHRLHGLEDELGVQLVRRGPRGLVLTEAGRRYREPVAEAFALLAGATADLLGPDLSRPLTVSLTSSIGIRWLMPRFSRFRARHPEIEIAILSTARLADMRAGEADVALRYGDGAWPGLCAEPVLRLSVFPLCAPQLRDAMAGLPPAQALSGAPLIRGYSDEWPAWLAAAGLEGWKPPRELKVADYSMAIAAAIDGQGVVLGYSGFVETEIAGNMLVRPFDLTVPIAKTYYLVYQDERLADPRIRAFRDWLMAEAETG